MRALRKRQACAEGMCAGKHRKGSDSEKLSLLLSLASEKEESEQVYLE
jgi:hypothetical protein